MSRSLQQPLPAEGRILLLRLSSIGDIVLTTPLVRVLRSQFPRARIDFVIKSQFVDLVRANPHLDRVLPVDVKKGFAGLRALKQELRAVGYDVIFDLHDNFRTLYLRNRLGAPVFRLKKYKFKRFLLVRFGVDLYQTVRPVFLRYLDAASPLGISDDGKGLEFFLDPSSVEKTAQYLEKAGGTDGKQLFAVAPGAGFATKRWPQEYFAELLRTALADHSAKAVLLGNASDRPICSAIAEALPNKAVINAAGQLSLMESAAALDRCDLFIGNDTGLMHLAAALKKPVVAVFGPTTRQMGFFPYGEKSRVVENSTLSCRPCTHMGRQKCPKKHFKCMVDVKPGDVLPAVRELLTV